MNNLTVRASFSRWWLETTTELGRDLGAPRPFRLYVDVQIDIALMESIRKPPSRQARLNMLEDTECIGSAEWFAAILLDGSEIDVGTSLACADKAEALEGQVRNHQVIE